MTVSKASPISSRWIGWLLAAGFYLYEMVLRFSPSVMTESLMVDFGVSSLSLGVLSSTYYYAYVPLQIPCGWLVDRYGPRLVVTISCLVCAIGAFVMASTSNLAVAQAGRFLMGAGSACAFISCLAIVAHEFSIAQFALLAGLSNVAGNIGGVLAGAPLAILVNEMGWRGALTGLAWVGVCLALLCYLKIKDETRSASTIRDLARTINAIIKLPQIWLTGIVGGIMYVPISVFSELWAVPFFMATYNVPNTIAATIGSTMVCIGMMCGSPLVPILCDYTKSYVGMMKMATTAMAVLFFAISCGEYFPMGIMYGLCYLLGLVSGAQVLCFTLAKHASPIKAMEGTLMGVVNALVMMSGLVFQPLVGHILDIFWKGEYTPSGAPFYCQDAYQYALCIMPLSLCFCYFLLMRLHDQQSAKAKG